MNRAPTGPLFPFSSDSSVADGVMAAWQTRLAAREAELLARDADLTLQVTELTARAAELKRQIEERELKIQKLTFELARLKRIRFGAKTEAFSQEQRDLFVDTGTEDVAAVVAELEPASPTAAKSPGPRQHPGRNRLPPELPRRHEPDSCTCGQCGRDLVKIGEDISEQLDVELAKFFVHRPIRPQYARRQCETVSASADSTFGHRRRTGGSRALCLGTDPKIPGSPAVVSTGEDRRPSRGPDRPFDPGPRQVGQFGVRLQPLADRLAERLRRGRVLHADETER